MSYKLQIIDQKTGNQNRFFLNKPEMLIQLENLLDTQKQSEIIIIEKR